jgi:hypothetical protein
LRRGAPLAEEKMLAFKVCSVAPLQTTIRSFSSQRRNFRPPFSLFGSSTGAWRDLFRNQAAQKRQHSPFVQAQYAKLLRGHPLPEGGGVHRPFVLPLAPSPRRSPTKTFSYLKDRLARRKDPHANARRNALLRAWQLTRREMVRVQQKQRRSRRRPMPFVPCTKPTTMRVGHVARYSRRRQLRT